MRWRMEYACICGGYVFHVENTRCGRCGVDDKRHTVGCILSHRFWIKWSNTLLCSYPVLFISWLSLDLHPNFLYHLKQCVSKMWRKWRRFFHHLYIHITHIHTYTHHRHLFIMICNCDISCSKFFRKMSKFQCCPIQILLKFV